MNIETEAFVDHEVRMRMLEQSLRRIDYRFDKLQSLLLKGIAGIIVTIFIPVALHALGWV
jgi:hypothetical protein